MTSDGWKRFDLSGSFCHKYWSVEPSDLKEFSGLAENELGSLIYIFACENHSSEPYVRGKYSRVRSNGEHWLRLT